MTGSVRRSTAPDCAADRIAWPACAALVASAAASCMLLAWLLWRAGHGFEFSDEGYYLAWIADPWLYRESASQFGFVYHPLYQGLDGDLAGLRRVNLLLTWLLGYALFREILASGHASDPKPRTSPWSRLVSAAALASCCLVAFSSWLVTPNYNSLALQGMLLAGWGLVRLLRRDVRIDPLAASLLAAGGALTFLAKPTSAAAMAVLFLFAASPVAARAWRSAAASFVAAALLLLLAAIAIDGSAAGFVQRLIGGARIMREVGGGYTAAELMRWDTFSLPAREWLSFVAVALGCAIAAGWPSRGTVGRIASAVILLPSFASLAAILTPWPRLPPPSDHLALQLLAAALGIGAGALFAALRRERADAAARSVGVVLSLALLPAAYAFGSNNNYWLVGSNAASLWVAAAVLLLWRVRSDARVSVLALGAIVQLLSIALLAIGLQRPYRQPLPLDQQLVRPAQVPVRLRVAMSASYAAYLDTLSLDARRAGLTPGTPMLDLTGQSPAALHALDAAQIGMPWWIGGYRGSERVAATALDALDCDDLARAWLLIEPDGPRALSLDLLQRFGAESGRDYVIASRVDAPAGSGGYPDARAQQLLAPRRGAAEAADACRRARTAGPMAPRTLG